MKKQAYDIELLAERLWLEREKKGMKLWQVARATGLHESTLSAYETGKRTPQLANIILLADYYGVTVEYLAGREDLLETKGEKDGE